jgi:hypothetical protein
VRLDHSIISLSSANNVLHRQKIPIHGSQHPKASGRVEREDTRHPKDPGHGSIPEETEGLSTCLSFKSIPCSYLLLQPDAEPLETTFELNDTLYAKALVPPTEEVYLWLGANVMLAYPIAEAETLLESKLSAAQQNLENCEEDLDFLREQITVSP